MFKPKIQWIEPQEFKSAIREDAKKPNPLLVLLGLPLLLSWYANKDESGVPLWVAIILCFIFGVFIVYGVPFLFYRLPTKVQLHKKAIIKHDRQQPKPIEYKKIKEFSILDAGAVSILTVIGIDGTEHLIGMPKDVDQSSVKSYLIEKGVAWKADPGDSINSVTSLRDSTT